MAENIENIYKFSELAFAAYAENLTSGMSQELLYSALINNIPGSSFSEQQANELISQYKVVSHKPNTSSGFSATLFQDVNTEGPMGSE